MDLEITSFIVGNASSRTVSDVTHNSSQLKVSELHSFQSLNSCSVTRFALLTPSQAIMGRRDGKSTPDLTRCITSYHICVLCLRQPYPPLSRPYLLSPILPYF